MIPFQYLRPGDVTGALEAGAAPNSRFIAGGTNLLDLMKLEVERPARLIDINGLVAREPEMGAVSDLPQGGLRLGALARMSDVAWDARVRDRYPLVSKALLLAASGQIRNMASLGGNILQRTRCPYFRDTATACNKRTPGSGCAALHGVNRTHAVLGTSEACIATHPSDLAVALSALDAIVLVRSSAGVSAGASAAERRIEFSALHTIPGLHPEQETALHHGDLIIALELPPLSFARTSTYVKVRDRASFAFALASAAVAVELRGDTIVQARVALGGVATKPWRSHAAEAALAGRVARDATFREAADIALAGAQPRRDNAFKIELAKRTLVRALTEVTT